MRHDWRQCSFCKAEIILLGTVLVFVVLIAARVLWVWHWHLCCPTGG